SIGKLSEARTSGLTATGIATASATAALTTLAATAALTALPTLRGNAITDITNLLNRRFNRGSQRLLLIAGERDVGFSRNKSLHLIHRVDGIHAGEDLVAAATSCSNTASTATAIILRKHWRRDQEGREQPKKSFHRHHFL